MQDRQNLKRPTLPVSKVFKEALKFPFQQTRHFWIWVLTLCLVSFVISKLENFSMEAISTKVPLTVLIGVGTVLDTLWKGLVFTLLAIGCHRIILLEEQYERWVDFFKWSHRETRFFIWSFLIYLIAIFMMAPFVMVSLYVLKAGFVATQDLLQIELIETVGGRGLSLGILPTVYFLFLYFLSRGSLVLPATAIDEKPTLSWVWDNSTGNGWRLTLITGTIPFLALVAFFLKVQVTQVPIFSNEPIFSHVDVVALLNVLPGWFLKIGEIFCSLLLSMLEVALLSEAFKELQSMNEIKTSSIPHPAQNR